MRFIVLSIVFHVILFLSFSNIKKENLTEQNKKIVTVEFLNDNLSPKKDFVKQSVIQNNESKESKVLKEVFDKVKGDIPDESSKEERILENKSEIQNSTIVTEMQITNNPEANLIVSESKPTTEEPKILGNSTEISNVSISSSNQINYSDSVNPKEKSGNNGSFEEVKAENFIAKNQDVEGLSYKILAFSDPEYPLIAKKAGYKNAVTIKTRFLVNGEGKIEEIKFYDNETKFGFREEVEKALKKWKFSPVKFNGKSSKMYFYKSFVFKLN